jgi:F0F1-type ATP synthase assembly protein I
MKLLPKQPRVKTADPNGDSLGLGIEAAVILALFFFAGFGLDRLFSTTPVFMIVMVVIGSVGLFAKYKYSYDAKMDEHEAQRVAREASRRSAAASSQEAS